MDACERLCVSAGPMCQKSGMHCTLFNFQHALGWKIHGSSPLSRDPHGTIPHTARHGGLVHCMCLPAHHMCSKAVVLFLGCHEISKKLEKAHSQQWNPAGFRPRGRRGCPPRRTVGAKVPHGHVPALQCAFSPLWWPGSKKKGILAPRPFLATCGKVEEKGSIDPCSRSQRRNTDSAK